MRSRPERDRLLVEMTDEVSDLVLVDNEQQARALTLDGHRSAAQYDEAVGFVEILVGSGVADRLDDGLPTREELLANPARAMGLPRPVLAVLLGRVKNWAFREVLKSPVIESAAARPLLDAYFPTKMRDLYASHFDRHPLKREIIATVAVNHLVNHAGIGFLHRVMGATGADVGQVIEAYLDVDRREEF